MYTSTQRYSVHVCMYIKVLYLYCYNEQAYACMYHCTVLHLCDANVRCGHRVTDLSITRGRGLPGYGYIVMVTFLRVFCRSLNISLSTMTWLKLPVQHTHRHVHVCTDCNTIHPSTFPSQPLPSLPPTLLPPTLSLSLTLAVIFRDFHSNVHLEADLGRCG